MGVATASCSSSDEPSESSQSVDAGADATAVTDGSKPDVATERDAGLVDAAALPVVCESTPCVTALVTTLGANIDDRSEGFCALLSDGTVACWGANGAGQLGRGDDAPTVDSANAARVTGLTDVVSLDHTCAVDKNGAVWCWGTGPFLQPDAGAPLAARSPVKLDIPPATKIGTSYATACAAVSDGLLCWGSNANGQLQPLTDTPGPTGQPKSIALPPGGKIEAISVGLATFVLRDDGSLTTWGANPPIGRLSPIFPDPYPQKVPIEGIKATDLVYDNACATAGGRGYCWGARVQQKQWGGSGLDRAVPEPVIAPEPITDIATTHTYLIDSEVHPYRWCAVGISGKAYCWGANDSGQAGDGTQDHAYDATKVVGLPGPVARIKTTPNTTCALLTSGKVYCWGSNYNGQLGNGENRGRNFVPAEVKLP
ncbi:hypothetical protein AKJ09_07102 [Labilithrix luteola]|uniref:BNR repeat domain protein n=1 Tax=Labilithrix luteola TaxID=1391654 RepID=A0A0K1Q3Y3_9BACT|nr:hypothetical protein [Labilithrix luteola]AKV00439.1 hypothetical protein AKJ09_07102 [Labilithrix luteola]